MKAVSDHEDLNHGSPGTVCYASFPSAIFTSFHFGKLALHIASRRVHCQVGNILFSVQERGSLISE